MSSISVTDQQYGNYLIAFIDILGFKEIVERSTHELAYFQQILAALEKIEHVVAYNDGKRKTEGSQYKMTQFSDSLVISCPYDYSMLFPMILNLDLIQKILANEGVIVRGGLTSGLLYHEGNIAFGPAFVRAYELESKKAIYPRIILDPTLLDGTANPSPTGIPLDDAAYYAFKNGTLKQDSDGYYFINFLGGNFSKTSDAKKLEPIISERMSRLYANDPNTKKIREKLNWLLNYINDSK